ncbi:hypothetical protein [Massilia sp. NR 4-1]|uniref:hypothetical protein n=1 Tax=Massilia sp. NR 4-1 TaxID=1678028 RepID=UPI001680719F|nr:hypothetical protein [Massilia sp. NR 4-1]
MPGDSPIVTPRPALAESATSKIADMPVAIADQAKGHAQFYGAQLVKREKLKLHSCNINAAAREAATPHNQIPW